jgi:hypothetical protein
MASLGQYQSFALISYSAIQKQLAYVNGQIAIGCDEGDVPATLFIAKNYTDTVLSYSTNCISVIGLMERDIVTICNWLCRNVNFTTKPIASLDPTYLNGEWPDFNQNDFNPNDFA